MMIKYLTFGFLISFFISCKESVTPSMSGSSSSDSHSVSQFNPQTLKLLNELPDSIGKSSYRCVAFSSQTQGGKGTVFFIKSGKRTFLVTNKHGFYYPNTLNRLPWNRWECYLESRGSNEIIPFAKT